MSFGFSISDFITVIETANKIRKEFVEAPAQFKAISEEVRNLSIVVQDVEIDLSARELGKKQKSELRQIAKSCHDVLIEIEQLIDKYNALESSPSTIHKTVKKTWKRLKWDPDEVHQLRNRISSNINLLNAFNLRITRNDVLELKNYNEDQERQNILDWLSKADYASRQTEISNQRQPESGQWLLVSPEIQSWIELPNQTLFCPGIPGAGKTFLTSIMIDELCTRYKSNSGVGIAYIYFDYSQNDKQGLQDMLASLLKQLAQRQPSLPVNLKKRYRDRFQPGSRLLDETKEDLHCVINQFSRVFIIIDALDECQSSRVSRDHLLSEIFGLQNKYNVNFLATSRYIPEIQERFRGKPFIKIQASNEDVRSYVAGRLMELPQFVSRSAKLQDLIVAEITRAVDGMFLLARLHVNSLIGKGTARALRNALKSLPIGSNAYDSAYKAAMERIQGQVRDQVDMAQQVLSWITCAKRPLTMVELQNALAVDIGEPYLDEENLPDEEDIISACRGLVTVDERSNMVRLIHYTTKEYFVRTWTDWFPVAHQVIADTCLTYLSFEVFQSMPYRIGVNMRAHLEEYPLYRYSACYWGIHMRERHGNTALCRRFLMNSVKVATFNDVFIFEMSRTQKGWHRIYYLQGMTGIHFAAYFGLVCMVQELIKFGIAADTRSTDGKTPLSFAAMEGHKLTVMLLLKEGANPNTKDIKGQTPLMLTIRNHDKSVMRLHLERFDDIENKDKTGQTPLFTASMTEYESVVRLLLEKGANIEAQDKIGQTPLFAASMTKLESVVGFLLASGAYIETRDNTGQTPLFAASAAAHVSVVELLLQKGADIEARDHAGQTPLFAASTAEHESVVRLLLAKGADLEARDDRGRTALFAASAWARSSVIKLLVMQGADLRVRNIDGMTALSEAIENCQPSAVQTLLILSGNFLAHETLPTTLVWKKDAASLNAVLRNMGLAEHMEFFRISHTLCRIRVTAAWLYITLSTRKPD